MTFTPKSFISQHFKGLALTLTAICMLGSSVAAQTHFTTTGSTDALGGSIITNVATLTYNFAGTPATVVNSNTVNVYVNQIDAFYFTNSDMGLSKVATGQNAITSPGAGIAISNSIVNLSNGPIKLTLATAASTLTPIVAGATIQPLATYAYTSSTGGVVVNGSTITIPQGVTANLTVTVTPPAGTTAGAWDMFAMTLTDVSTPTTVNAANVGSFTVTPYNSTSALWIAGGYAGLDVQVTSEVDVASNVNFGKLQLLDSTCGGSAFATTSVTGNTRTPTTATFPALNSIVWQRSGLQIGQPVTGTTGLLAVSANPGECIVYQIVLNNPLTSVSIPAGAAITDTLVPNVSFVTTTGRTILTGGIAGNVGTSAPSLTTTGIIPAGGNGTVVLQYEALVK